MCVSSRVWLTLEQNNYLIDTKESNLWHTRTHTRVFPHSHLKSWQFTQQHIFATSDSQQLSWRAERWRLAQKSRTTTQLWTPSPRHTRVSTNSGLSDQNKLYRFRRFYFSLNTMTTGRKPARISYYLLQHVHINPHVPKKKQLKRRRHQWKHSSRLHSVEHIIDERRDLE